MFAVWFVGLRQSRTNRARFAAFHVITAVFQRMEDAKSAVGLSVSPSDLIVVSYFCGPILAGLANRHLLPSGNRYPSNLLHPRKYGNCQRPAFSNEYYIVSFSYNNF